MNPEQFKLFYGAQELQSAITNTGDRVATGRGAKESMPQMWDRKLSESKNDVGHGSGVHASLSQKGFVGDPLEVVHSPDWGGEKQPHGLALSDGHHRVVAAADIERTTGRNVWIPVNNYHNETRQEYGDKPRRDALVARQMVDRGRPAPLNTAQRQKVSDDVADIARYLK